MNALLILVPVSLILVGLAVAAFVWATRAGQFDDLDSPGLTPLLEPEVGADAAAPRETPP